MENNRKIDVKSLEYFSAIGEILSKEIHSINELLQHSASKGTSNEEKLISILRSFLPDYVGVCSGIVVKSKLPSTEEFRNGSYSQIMEQADQSDIILYDKYHFPKAFSFTDLKLVPIESVLGVIEVKTTVNLAKLKSASKNLKSIHDFNIDSQKKLFLAIFAYKSEDQNYNKFDNWLQQLGDTQHLSGVYALNIGFSIPERVSDKGAENMQLGKLKLSTLLRDVDDSVYYFNQENEITPQEDSSNSDEPKLFHVYDKSFLGSELKLKNALFINDGSSHPCVNLKTYRGKIKPKFIVTEETKTLVAFLFHVSKLLTNFCRTFSQGPEEFFLKYIPMEYWEFSELYVSTDDEFREETYSLLSEIQLKE